jgi:hypothetical protein
MGKLDRERGWPRRAAGGCVLAAVVVSMPAWGASGARAAEEAKPHPRERTLLKRRWGVEVKGVRLASAGHMLEFRYRVLDERKARVLFERNAKPSLVHERTGARLAVPVPPKTGPLRTSDAPVRDRTYWMFFANPGRLVRPGETVSVVVGDFSAGGLVVE